MFNNDLSDALLILSKNRTNPKICEAAADIISGLSCDTLLVEFFEDDLELLKYIFPLEMDIRSVKEKFLKSLINLSVSEKISIYLGTYYSAKLIEQIIHNTENESYKADLVTLLANISRIEPICGEILISNNNEIQDICKALDSQESGVINIQYHILRLLANLSVHKPGRQWIIDRQILYFVRDYKEERLLENVFCITKNCLSEPEAHSTFTRQEYLEFLIYPLLSSSMSFRPEEMNTLKLLPKDEIPAEKSIHPNLIIRESALDSFLQLASNESSRRALKDLGLYPIIREYHLINPDDSLDEKLFDLVQLLLGDEII